MLKHRSGKLGRFAMTPTDKYETELNRVSAGTVPEPTALAAATAGGASIPILCSAAQSSAVAASVGSAGSVPGAVPVAAFVWVRCPRSPYCGWCWSAKLHGSLTPFAKNSRLSGPMAPLGFQFCMHKGWGSTEIICKCVGSPTAFNRKHCRRRPGRRGRCNPQSTTTSTFPESSSEKT